MPTMWDDLLIDVKNEQGYASTTQARTDLEKTQALSSREIKALQASPSNRGNTYERIKQRAIKNLLLQLP